MIRILVYDSGCSNGDSDRIVSATTAGHSSKEVCSAVSVLTQTFAAYLNELQSEHFVVADIRQSESDGQFAVDAVCDAEDVELMFNLDSAITMLRIGISGIYSDDVEFEDMCALEDCVERMDCLDQIAAWREECGLERHEMVPPYWKREKVTF